MGRDNSNNNKKTVSPENQNGHFSQAIKLVSSMISHIYNMLLDIMCRTVLYPFSVPPKTTSSKSKHEANIRQIINERHSAEHDNPLQTVKVIKSRESLRCLVKRSWGRAIQCSASFLDGVLEEWRQETRILATLALYLIQACLCQSQERAWDLFVLALQLFC